VAIGAALLAVLVGGAVFIGGGRDQGVVVTATPTPTPTVAPTLTPVAVSLPNGRLDAGTYTAHLLLAPKRPRNGGGGGGGWRVR